MAADESRFDDRWRSFEAFREEFRQRAVMVGVDRVYARRWMLGRGPGCPLGVQAAGYLLIALAVAGLVGSGYVVWHGAYLLGVFLLVLAFLSWRLFVQVAIPTFRSAAMADEALFRRWFEERKVSVFVKATGEYIWNDRETPA